MIAMFDVVQGEQQWFEIRWGKVGGTLAKGLFVDSDTLMIKMLADKLEEFELSEDDFQSAAMENGTMLEPEARAQLSDYTNLKFLPCGWLQSESIPILGISPDGITEDLKTTCELKCPERAKHTSTVYNKEIPLDNIHQCVHYFTVNSKLEKHYFVSFRPQSKVPLFVKELTRDSLVNLGTASKPQIKTVGEWSQLARANAIVLQAKINEGEIKVTF